MHGHQPRKRFGQHFLADPHHVTRILDAVGPKPGDRVVEIGPGLGALTGGLVERPWWQHGADHRAPRTAERSEVSLEIDVAQSIDERVQRYPRLELHRLRR